MRRGTEGRGREEVAPRQRQDGKGGVVTGVAVVSKLGREVEMAALVGDGFYDKCRP